MSPSTVAQYARFHALRRELYRQIEAALVENDHHKSYEGKCELIFPDYFEAREAAETNPDVHLYEDPVGIQVHCYIVGPSRHWLFEGTFDACLDQFETWLKRYSFPEEVIQYLLAKKVL